MENAWVTLELGLLRGCAGDIVRLLRPEWALLRVRHRHEKARDPHKYTFGELLREASKELDEQIERMKRTGKDDYGESFT